MTEQLKSRGDAGTLTKTPSWVQKTFRQHCHADHPEWVSYLEAAAMRGPLEKFALSVNSPSPYACIRIGIVTFAFFRCVANRLAIVASIPYGHVIRGC
jgi:hypothetical protein